MFQKVWYWAWRIALGIFAASILSVLVFRFVPVPVTPLMIIRCGEQLVDGKSVKLQKSWKSLDQISPKLVQAVVASEDNLFLTHHGFDFAAMQKAMQYNEKKKGKKIKGGSTISQQTAKNVFLWPGRSYIRKGLEAYFTVLIELIWGKERIMEVYLNVIEMGDGIYGAEAASQTFFKKPAIRLNKAEAAAIAAVLPSPLRWSPANPTVYTLRREAWILRNMGHLPPVKFE